MQASPQMIFFDPKQLSFSTRTLDKSSTSWLVKKCSKKTKKRSRFKFILIFKNSALFYDSTNSSRGVSLIPHYWKTWGLKIFTGVRSLTFYETIILSFFTRASLGTSLGVYVFIFKRSSSGRCKLERQNAIFSSMFDKLFKILWPNWNINHVKTNNHRKLFIDIESPSCNCVDN